MNIDKFILYDYLIGGEEYNEKMSHCATICQLNSGMLLAYYTAQRECHSSQRVYLIFFDGRTYSKPYKIDEGTGNPVLWNSGLDAILMHSKFEMGATFLIDKWKFCSNWLKKISLINGELIVSEEKMLDMPVGYLGRCAPIWMPRGVDLQDASKVSSELLLPIYFEDHPFGEVLSSKDGWEWERRGRIGGDGLLMQPTLWYDGSKLCSLSRNYIRTGLAFYSESLDMGKTWSDPVYSKIPNHNNSIIAIYDETRDPLLIWNDSKKRGRLILSDHKMNEICVLNKSNYGAYPNYCFDREDNLHVVFTDNFRIRHIIFSNDFIKSMKATS